MGSGHVLSTHYAQQLNVVIHELVVSNLAVQIRHLVTAVADAVEVRQNLWIISGDVC